MTTVLIIILAIAAGFFAGLWIELRSRIVEISDDAPAKDYKCASVLKLQDQLKPFIKTEDGKVKLRLIKERK